MVAPERRDVKKDATGVGPVAQNHGVPRGRAGQDPQPHTRVAQSPSDAPPHHHDARYRDPQGDVDRQTHNSAEHEFGGDG